MWPFTITKKTEEPKIKIEPPIGIGERFKYLGIDMICSRHSSYPSEHPVIVADYVNKNGVLKQWAFHPCDWVALNAERVRSTELKPC